MYAPPELLPSFIVRVPAVRLVVVADASIDSLLFPALSVVFVFTLYTLFVVNPVNVFADCQLDQLLPLYSAYCTLAIPDKASVCLLLTVIELVVVLTPGAIVVGAVLSIFIV